MRAPHATPDPRPSRGAPLARDPPEPESRAESEPATHANRARASASPLAADTDATPHESYGAPPLLSRARGDDPGILDHDLDLDDDHATASRAERYWTFAAGMSTTVFGLVLVFVLIPWIASTPPPPATCTTMSTKVTARYCCGIVDCDECSTSSLNAPCDAQLKSLETRDPIECAASNGAGNSCSPPTSRCANGYKCCGRTCDWCPCPDNSCRTECNCRCNATTANNECTLRCDVCHDAVVHVVFDEATPGFFERKRLGHRAPSLSAFMAEYGEPGSKYACDRGWGARNALGERNVIVPPSLPRFEDQYLWWAMMIYGSSVGTTPLVLVLWWGYSLAFKVRSHGGFRITVFEFVTRFSFGAAFGVATALLFRFLFTLLQPMNAIGLALFSWPFVVVFAWRRSRNAVRERADSSRATEMVELNQPFIASPDGRDDRDRDLGADQRRVNPSSREGGGARGATDIFDVSTDVEAEAAYTAIESDAGVAGQRGDDARSVPVGGSFERGGEDYRPEPE